MPELFARHLATHLPEAMRLTQLSIRRETNGWQFQLAGFAREQTGGYLALIGQLDQSLSNGIFHAQITDSSHQRVFGAASGEQGLAPHPPGGAKDEKSFFATGLIR